MKTTLEQLPDLAASFTKLRILIELRNADPDTTLGHSILLAFFKKIPSNEIIKFVKSQAKDNPKLMYTVIGEDLTKTILNFQL